MNKNLGFVQRLGFALNGIRSTWRTENSFKAEVCVALGAVGLLLYFRPAAIWWALFIITIAAVLGAELMNTALENLMDKLHPEVHPLIGLAKDCAAGAVLLLCIASVGVVAAMLISL